MVLAAAVDLKVMFLVQWIKQQPEGKAIMVIQETLALLEPQEQPAPYRQLPTTVVISPPHKQAKVAVAAMVAAAAAAAAAAAPTQVYL